MRPPNSLPRNNAAGTTFTDCRYDFTRDIDIIPENEQTTLLLRGSIGFGQAKEHVVSLEYLRAENEVISRIAPAPTTMSIPATSPFFPVGAPITAQPGLGGLPGAVANWREVPAGKRSSRDETTTERLLLDLSGAVAGWDYRVGGGQSKSKVESSVFNGYTDDSIVQAGVTAGTVNPFGPQSPAGTAVLNAATVNAVITIGDATVDFFDARVTKEFSRCPPARYQWRWAMSGGRRNPASKILPLRAS